MNSIKAFNLSYLDELKNDRLKYMSFKNWGGLFLSLLYSCLFFNVLILDDSIPQGVLSSKMHFCIIIGTLYIVCYSLHSFFHFKTAIFNLNSIDISLILFSFFLSLNYLVKIQLYNDSLLHFIISVLVYLLFKHSISRDRGTTVLKSICIVVFLLSGSFEALRGLLQVLGMSDSKSIYTMTGTFTNPGVYGIYLASIFTFSIGLLLFFKETGLKAAIIKSLASINILLILLILPSTQSRTTWLSISGSLIFLFFNKVQAKSWIKNRKAAILCICLMLICITPIIYKYKEASAYGRFLTWRISMPMIQKNFVTGIGFNQFQYKYPDYQYSFFKYGSPTPEDIQINDTVTYTFNDPLQILIENGIIGFALFGILIMVIIISYRMSEHPIFLSAYAGILSILISALFSYPFEVSSIWHIFLFLVALVSSFITREKRVLHLNTGIRIIISFLLFAVATFILIKQHVIYKAKQTWESANIALQEGFYSEALNSFDHVQKELPFEKTILLGYGKCLLLMNKYEESQKVLLQANKFLSDPFLAISLAEIYTHKRLFDKAETEFDKSIYMLPNRVYPRYLLAKMLVKKHDLKKARQIAIYIQNMNIKVESPATRQMLNEMAQLFPTKN